MEGKKETGGKEKRIDGKEKVSYQFHSLYQDD